MNPALSSYMLGWTDSTHAVIGGEGFTNRSDVADLVTVGSTLTCSSLIPATEKRISSLEMAPDRSAVFFTALGPSGAQVYSVPTNGAVTEPKPGTYPRIAGPTPTVYYPGNY